MKTILIVHGIGGHGGIHWQKWLHHELVKKHYKVLMPDMPGSDRPDRKTWLKEIIKTIGDENREDLIIVGHSLGATTALDFIEQSVDSIEGLISVSGFAEDYGAELNSYFLSERQIDFDKVAKRLKWPVAIYGNDDPYVPQEALKQVADGLGIKPIIIPKGGHLNTESGYTEFPKLLEIIQNKVL